MLEALFKIQDDELTFQKAVDVAVETEDAAKVAKEMVCGSKASASTTPVLKVVPDKQKTAGKELTRTPI